MLDTQRTQPRRRVSPRRLSAGEGFQRGYSVLRGAATWGQSALPSARLPLAFRAQRIHRGPRPVPPPPSTDPGRAGRAQPAKTPKAPVEGIFASPPAGEPAVQLLSSPPGPGPLGGCGPTCPKPASPPGLDRPPERCYRTLRQSS